MAINEYIVSEEDLTNLSELLRNNFFISSSKLTWPNDYTDVLENIEHRYIENGLIFDSNYTNSEITELPTFALAFRSHIVSINLPNCSIISNMAFFKMNSLATISIPKCQTLGPTCFMDGNLLSIHLPLCVSIGHHCFCNCNKLSYASLPKCQNLGVRAFTETALSSIYLPLCNKIETYTFSGCSLLTSVSLPKCSQIDVYGFLNCSQLTNVSLPLCETIASGGFCYCNSLSTLTLPKCSQIEDYTFYGCYNLVSLYLLSTSVVHLLGTNVFFSTPIAGYSTSAGKLGTIYVPTSLVTSYQNATNWAAFSDKIVGI